MNLPKITDLEVSNKKVLVRADLDVETSDFEKDLRIQSLIPTLDYLKDQRAEIIIIAHKGRPSPKATAGETVQSNENLSLKPFQPFFAKWGAKVEENLRFNPGESFASAQDKEKYDPEFARRLAGLGDVYVNEAFATSHRESASIVGLPKLLPHAAGFHFLKEIENLSKVFGSKALFILGGIKKDKLEYLEDLKKNADKILVGGRLPVYTEVQDDPKILFANLVPDKEDLTINSMEKFKEEIAKAGAIVLVGPMGKFEEEGHRQGTEEIFTAVAQSKAFKIAGGGDTEKAISLLGVGDQFDWISVGGGAMLEFLSKKTLPGIEALL